MWVSKRNVYYELLTVLNVLSVIVSLESSSKRRSSFFRIYYLQVRNVNGESVWKADTPLGVENVHLNF